MRKKRPFITNPLVYIIFITVGTFIFIVVSLKVRVSVYVSCTGVVNVVGDKAFIVVEDGAPVSEDAFYYIDRDDRLESVKGYSVEFGGYEIDNVMELENNMAVKVDVRSETITLFQAIFERAGKLQ